MSATPRTDLLAHVTALAEARNLLALLRSKMPTPPRSATEEAPSCPPCALPDTCGSDGCDALRDTAAALDNPGRAG